MSWCGGGEIRATPGVECRTRAMTASTLCPGNWPPSPGLAPCAILICIMSALTRYSVVTPNRPEATCLIAERIESPFGIGFERARLPPADPVHRDRRRVMRLARDRAETHCACGEALDDLPGRLDFGQRHRLAL